MKGYQTKINEILKEKNKLLIKLKVRLKLVKKKILYSKRYIHKK